MTLKSFLTASLLLLFGCSSHLDVKVYTSNVDYGGFYRRQDQEIVPYEKSHGFFCMKYADMRKLIKVYKTCQDLCPKNILTLTTSDLGIKIYISIPEQKGIVRKQSNELIRYDETSDFNCTPEDGMRKIAEVFKSCMKLCQ